MLHRIAIPGTPGLPMFELAIPCGAFDPPRGAFPRPFPLAAAGLLDGRTVTAHWMHAAELTRRWPAVRVEPNVLYTDDGQILTSAGSAAGLDLCLHIVSNDHGTRIANALARRLVIPPHREGGQAQYIEQPVPASGAQGLGSSLDWAREHLQLPLTVEEPARQAAMTRRTNPRRFRGPPPPPPTSARSGPTPPPEHAAVSMHACTQPYLPATFTSGRSWYFRGDHYLG